MSPESPRGAFGRSDPLSQGLGGWAGVALPFGRASHLAMTATHEYATSARTGHVLERSPRRRRVKFGEASALLGAKAGVITGFEDP